MLHNAPFEKFRYAGKEDKAGGGYYEKVSEKVSRKPYSLYQNKFQQHYVLSLMFAQFRKQQLQSYPFHSRDRPWSSCRDVVRFKKGISQNCEF